jgi:hypothetical protein
MKKSLANVFADVKRTFSLRRSVDIKVFDSMTGFSISRKKEVHTRGLGRYLREFDPDPRVATFVRELGVMIGAQVGARVELWLAGRRVNGRRKVANL